MLPAGAFDQRIAIDAKSVSKNSIGEDVITWVPVADIWAKVMPLRGAAFVAANQQQHTLDARLLIRKRAGLTTGMRLTWGGDLYDITNIVPGTGPYVGTIEIHAIKGVRDGR